MTNKNGNGSGAGKTPFNDNLQEAVNQPSAESIDLPEKDVCSTPGHTEPVETMKHSNRKAHVPPQGNSSVQAAGVPSLPHYPMHTDRAAHFGLSLKDIVTLILRRKWTALFVSILVAAPLVAFIWITFVPRYKARALVRIRPIIPYLVFKTEDSGKIQLYDLFVNTQVRIMQSSDILNRVLDQPEIRQTPWYTDPPRSLLQKVRKAPPTSARNRLKGSLSATTQKGTEIVEVTFSDTSTKDAQLVLNTVLDQYIVYIGEQSDAMQDKLYRQLVDQHKGLESEILGREDIINGLQTTLGTTDPTALISERGIRLDETKARLADVRQKVNMLKWEIKKVLAYDPNELQNAEAVGVEKQPRYSADNQWQQLNVASNRIQHEMDNSAYTPNHPDMIRLSQNLVYARKTLKERETQLDEQWSNRARQVARTTEKKIPVTEDTQLGYEEARLYLEHQLGRVELQQQVLLSEIQNQQATFDELFENAQLLQKQQNALLHKRELFNAVRQRLDQKNMERNAPGSIEVLMRAGVSSEPFNDTRIKLTLLTSFLAAGVGAAVAFYRANKRGAIYVAEDMPRALQTSFLGHVNMLKTDRSKGRSKRSREEQMQRIKANAQESMRMVRTALLSQLDGHDGKAILITSALAGTGKSHFTMMLGESLAQIDKKVLVVDADFYKMTLTKHFGFLEETGFLESINSRAKNRRRYVNCTDTPNMSFMAAGKIPEDIKKLEVISNGKLRACIDSFARHYDIILLDSPPILAVADAPILARQIDGVIMVERENISNCSAISDALVRLDAAGGRLLGTVFIGSSQRSQYGYGYGYGYGHLHGTSKKTKKQEQVEAAQEVED